VPLKGKTKHDILMEFRHEEILEAARKVFARKGYANACVEDIAHAAGIAKGTLYLYYASKHEIYWEALKRGLAALCDELEKKVGAERTSESKIRAFIAAKLTWFEENQDLFKIYHAEFAHAMSQPACLHKDFKGLHQRQMKLLTSALREGILHKAIRKLPAEAAALAILNVARGIITQRLLGWSKTKLQADIDFLFDLTWKGLVCR
jgi:AcrR family transcriptional regulator